MERISEELSDVIDPSGFRVRPPILSDVFLECENGGVHSFNGLCEASQKIVSGLPFAQSIDNFLHNNKTDSAIVLAGKIAIASIIIQEEQESTLYQGPVLSTPKRRHANNGMLSPTQFEIVTK